MTDPTLPRLQSDPRALLATGVDTDDTDLELDTANWTVDAGHYPLNVTVGGELVTAASATLGATVTLNGCTRSVNDIVRSHLAGIAVELAHPFRMTLGRDDLAVDTTPAPPSGGGGGDPGEWSVAFRSITDPAVQTPTVTPLPADIAHPSGGNIYGAGAGTTWTVTDTTTWATAVAGAGPGDLIDITANITSSLTYRGAKYGLAGGSAASGTAGNPIIIRCSGAGQISVADLSNNTAGLNITNCDHVWAVGVRVFGSQFGVYYRNVEGTATHPIRVAHNTIADTGHACLTLGGWFQAITSSGGTPPAGTGNEWGFSRYFLVENNTITSPGQTAAQFGECIYLGFGSSPGWVSYARDVMIRHNTLLDSGADYLDIKPGCSHVQVLDNTMAQGHFVFGAAMQVLYVASGINDRPAWYNFDPEIVIEGNRVWDGNLTNTDGSSANFVCQVSLAGVAFRNNLCWGFPNGAVGFRLRSEKAASQSQVAGEIWECVNNLFWMDNGVANVGAPASSPSAFNGAWLDARNNIGPTGATGVTHTATSADFVDSAAIPTVDSVDADATWETYGNGSAFDLDPASALIGDGASVADIDFWLDEDISQRDIPFSAPNPGPFQQHPANIDV